jgi:uridine kinase
MSLVTQAADEVATAILALHRDRPTRALIDGRSAAGKTSFSTTLAERLASSEREVLTVHFDDFHPVGYRPLGSSAYTPTRYLEEGFDFGAFERLVLAPTTPGGGRRVTLALAGVFDDRPNGEIELAEDGVLLVEGAFLLKPALRSWWDFEIWLDIGFETMIARAVARDVAWVGDPQSAGAIRRVLETDP